MIIMIIVLLVSKVAAFQGLISGFFVELVFDLPLDEKYLCLWKRDLNFVAIVEDAYKVCTAAQSCHLCFCCSVQAVE